MGAFSGRIRVSVLRTSGRGCRDPLALVVHELAANSLKYGALSVSTGTFDVSGLDQEENLVISSTEQGGHLSN